MRQEIIKNVFMVFISIVLSLCVYIFSGFDDALINLQQSVSKLNENVAVTGEKLFNQNNNIKKIERKIDKLEERFEKLQEKLGQ